MRVLPATRKIDQPVGPFALALGIFDGVHRGHQALLLRAQALGNEEGHHDVLVTDLSGAGLVTIRVYAGSWRGVVTGQDLDGRPVSDASCVSCHQAVGSDQFTPWAQTGHAEIFSANLDTSTHYGPNCFGCHTVGFNPDVPNSGFDETFVCSMEF